MPTPEPGFYYHFKHNPEVFGHGAYELVGVGISTENIEERFVIYRPLYKDSLAYQEGKKSRWVRPLAMFMENVTKDGKTFPRFARITDPEVIEKLEERRGEMYTP